MAAKDEILVMTALNDEDLVEEFIVDLLEAGLILSGVYWPIKVLYQWDGSIHIEEEYKLLLKARADFYDEIENYIIKKHHYKSPEIIKIDAVFGSKVFREHLMSRKTLT